MVVEKLNVVKADFAHSQRGITEHREEVFGQTQQRIRICMLQSLDRNLVSVMATLGILFAPFPEVFLIKLLKGSKVETLQCKNHSEKGRTNQSPSESGQKIRLC